MRQIAVIGLVLLVVGCDDSQQTSNANLPPSNATDPQPAIKAEEALVTDFKAPELAGLAVRDHKLGVQVVTPPSKRGTTPPPIGSSDLLWAFAPKAIFTSVNGTPARDAKHFRELMDAADLSKDVSLGQQLFLEDVGDGGVMIRTDPPEGQYTPAR